MECIIVDPDFNTRYSRHFPLGSIGKSGQLKLKGRRVLIAGMGGLGTSIAELLTSIGIGYLRIVDYDVIEISNLPRQKLYRDEDIGKAKVEIAADRLRLRNPYVEIDADTSRIDPLSAPGLLEGIDLVIDGLDKFSSRKALYRVAHKMGIPFIFTGAVAEQGNIMTFTQGADEPCLYCVVGNAGDDNQNSCEVLGVHPAILSLVTSIQASEAVKILLDSKPDLVGTMLYVDLDGLSFDKINFKKNPGCTFCSTDASRDELDQGKDGEVTKGMRNIGNYGVALVTSLCGRDTKIIDPEWELDWDFNRVLEKISEQYHIAVSGKKYVTITVRGVGISLLESGVATIRGAHTTKKAIEIYETLLDLII